MSHVEEVIAHIERTMGRTQFLKAPPGAERGAQIRFDMYEWPHTAILSLKDSWASVCILTDHFDIQPEWREDAMAALTLVTRGLPTGCIFLSGTYEQPVLVARSGGELDNPSTYFGAFNRRVQECYAAMHTISDLYKGQIGVEDLEGRADYLAWYWQNNPPNHLGVPALWLPA